MSETPSNMMPLGTKAPDFNLLDTVSGKKLNLTKLKSDVATVVMFICNHCPFVIHIHDKLLEVADEYIPEDISFIAISSNDAENYPEDGPDEMAALAEEKEYPFPYLYDETQKVAKAYDAACTPDFFIFDKNLKCVYRGRFDGASPGNSTKVTGKDIRNALDNILGGEAINKNQKASVGCNIKWKE